MKSRVGLGSITVVALVAMLFGALGGAIAGAKLQKTQIVKEVIAAGNGTPASNSDRLPPMSWSQVARFAGPAVVTIINQGVPQHDVFGNSIPGATAEGSGFSVDHSGHIVTNNHVIDGAATLTVVFSDGHKATAQLVRADPLSDLAVIQVQTRVPHILRFGDSNALRPGDPVLAIGSALGEYRNTVTSGVVSATGRTINEPNQVALHNMLQTDAAINQGNSGGPLLNDRGEVVGVNTAITRGSTSNDPFGLAGSSSVVAEGLGFAIPSSTVKFVAARLVRNRPPAFFGVMYVQVTQQSATLYGLPVGAYVRNVDPGSPADRAGIKPRDVITWIDGHALTDTNQLEQVIAQHSPGETAVMRVWRNNATLTLRVKLGAKPSPAKL